LAKTKRPAPLELASEAFRGVVLPAVVRIDQNLTTLRASARAPHEGPLAHGAVLVLAEGPIDLLLGETTPSPFLSFVHGSSPGLSNLIERLRDEALHLFVGENLRRAEVARQPDTLSERFEGRPVHDTAVGFSQSLENAVLLLL